MIRILGTLKITGRKQKIDEIASMCDLIDSQVVEAGRLQKKPPADTWIFKTPWYQFHQENLDDEIYNFIIKNMINKYFLNLKDEGIDYSLLTICPVYDTMEDSYGFILKNPTLQLLSSLSIDLEISPESLMPEAQYWCGHKGE